MANQMLLDDTRALRREQREARIARKRERRQAREFKRRRDTTPPVTAPLAPASTTTTTADEPAAELPAIAAPELPTTAVLAPAVKLAAEPQPAAPGPVADERELEPRPAERGERSSRRERDVAEFLARRDQVLSLARTEARERIERLGEEEAVCDALVALAHPQASPWRQHRERLSEAIASGRIPTVGAAARRACRGAAGDAARTSRRAPDPQLAMAVTVACAVVARAPWAAVRSRRAERSSPTGQPLPRAFWR
jgi:hypothetical protein